MKAKSDTKVFVGLSGGVDSSVAALRLIQAGYDVYGVFIKVWNPDWLVCNWEAERLDAMRVAAKLDIPFLTCDAEAAYRDEVADYFINEYTIGRTPNPDVMCNKAVKFGAFLQFAEEHGADYVATGHYVQVAAVGEETNRFEMQRGVDANKDQSYFLWTLTQQQLAKTLFPVGDTPKDTIRVEAEGAGLVTAQKKDSQGICFLGHIDIAEFLSHYTELVSGEVLDESGEVIGEHQGALIYTKGQRHGFSVTQSGETATPHYVTNRDLATNTITVSTKPPKEARGGILNITELNLIGITLSVGDTIQAQSRYRQRPFPVSVTEIDGAKIKLEVTDDTESISVGQSCVLYREDQCLGGGIIDGITHGNQDT